MSKALREGFPLPRAVRRTLCVLALLAAFAPCGACSSPKEEIDADEGEGDVALSDAAEEVAEQVEEEAVPVEEAVETAEAVDAADATDAVEAEDAPDGEAPPAPPGDTCLTAETAAAGTLTGQTTAGYANDYTGGPAGGCTSMNGKDRAYAVTIPAGQRLTVSVTSTTDGYDPALNLVAGPAATCAASPRVCLDGDNAGTWSTVNRVQHVNWTGSEATVFVVVDSNTSSDAGGAFTLEIAIDAPVTAGDTCAAAEAVPAGVLPGQTTTGYSNDYKGSPGTNGCTRSDKGRDRVYSISIPDGRRLAATVTPAAGFNSSIYLVASPAVNCDASPRVCLRASDTGDAGAADTILYSNYAGGALDVFIVVDSGAVLGAGDFTLTTAIDTPPEGDTCADATAIPAPGTLSGQTTAGYTNDYDPGARCTGFNTAGRDRVYAMSIPAGKTLTATVYPGLATWDPAVYFVAQPASGCSAAPACLAGADVGAKGAIEALMYTNATGSALDVFIVVDNFSATDRGAGFSMITSIDAL